jgi:hypothetical protein
MEWLLKQGRVWQALTLVFAALFLTCLLFGRPRISSENCDKIQIGWSRAQVENLLGLGVMPRYPDRSGVFFSLEMVWSDEYGNEIHVCFDREDGVTHKRFIPTQLSFQERLKRFFKHRIPSSWQ